jgi:hypothetical protein
MSSMVFSSSSMSCLRRLDILIFLLLSVGFGITGEAHCFFGACGSCTVQTQTRWYLVFFLIIVFLWTSILSQVDIQIQTWQILKLGEILCFVNTNFLGGQT